MIMQRLDSDDDQPAVITPGPADSRLCSPQHNLIPGMLYRGVPQDGRHRTLRIDSCRKTGSTLYGPTYVISRRTSRELNLAELFFG